MQLQYPARIATGQEVVDGHPVFRHQPGDPPAQRETCNRDAGDDAARRCQAEGRGGTVKLTNPDASCVRTAERAGSTWMPLIRGA